MSSLQSPVRKEFIIGGSDVGRITNPQIRGTVRASQPDVNNAEYYWPSLSGTTLQLSIAGTVTANYTITFSGNTLSTMLGNINSISPANIGGVFQDGYIVIKNLNGGAKNTLLITGGTSLSILGFTAYPSPNGISSAGEISFAPGSSTQNLLSKLTAKLDTLSDVTINRSLASVLTNLESLLSDIDKEVAVPVTFPVDVVSGVIDLGIGVGSDKLYTGLTGSADPGKDVLDNFFNFQDNNDNDVFIINNKVRVDSVTYGTLTDKTQSFVSWNTADGKSVFGGLSHWQKVKLTSNITSINGNLITCTGAQFITNKTKIGDTVYIASATNNTPFNHNGEFLVDSIYGEDTIGIKVKNNSDLLMGTDNPSSINPNKSGGESYGTLSILLGRFIPMTGKNGNLKLNLSPAPPDGTYKITVPVGRAIRSLQPQDFIACLVRQYGGQIELGSKFSGSEADALKSRIIISPRTAGSTYVLVMENKNGGIGTRIYAAQGLYHLTVNAYFDGTNWLKDTDGQAAYSVILNNTSLTFNNRAASQNTAWSNWENIATFPIYDPANNQITLRQGLNIGPDLTSSTNALVLRNKYTVSNDAQATYTFIEEATNPTNPSSKHRQYRGKSGDSVSTVNIKWDGTQWVKDIASSISIKIIKSKRGQLLYHNNDGNNNINDITGWTSMDDMRQFIFNEDFLAFINSTSSGAVGSHFFVETATNSTTQTSNTPNSTGMGFLRTSASAANAFNFSIRSYSHFNPRANDFILRFALKLNDISHLETLANDGFFIGIRFLTIVAPLERDVLGIALGNDVTKWKYRVGNVGSYVNNDLIDATTNYTTFSIERFSGIAYVYINGQFITSFVNTTDYQSSELYIRTKGTATGSEILYDLDYVKVWMGRNY